MHTPVELIKLLAAGGQAAVFLARLPLDGNSLIVVKVFYSPPSPFEVRSMKAVSLTTYAIRLLGQTRIPISNLVKYRQALTEHEVDISQFELIDGKNVLGFCYERLQGDLESVIISAERKVGNCTKMLVALQIGYFLRGIHAANYIFRDLKPSNILINSPLENMTPEQKDEICRHYWLHAIRTDDY
ncbi:kinase-like domain-containing protein [Paraphysoderma sedebokerense]|nr:kinase-like domain-containing protein [Paraphysoderma sedebokerense]